MCTGRNVLSKAVRMVDGFVVPPGLRFIGIPTDQVPDSDTVTWHLCVLRSCMQANSMPRPMGQYRTGLLLSQSILDGLNRLHRLTALQTLVGDDRSGATPDPIPNSEVKPGPPMILLSGKVGHCRQFGPTSGNAGGATSFLCRALFRPNTCPSVYGCNAVCVKQR
jgi:hypothetical protein